MSRSSQQRAFPLRFSEMLQAEGVKGSFQIGADIHRAANERGYPEGAPVLTARAYDVEHFSEMVLECREAYQKWLQAVNSDSATETARRWTDYLSEDSRLKRNPEILLGIDVYRAAVTKAAPAPRQGEGEDLRGAIGTVEKTLVESERQKVEFYGQKNLAYWRHDLINAIQGVMTPLTLFRMENESPMADRISGLLYDFDQSLSRVTFINESSFFEDFEGKIVPKLDWLLEELQSSNDGQSPRLSGLREKMEALKDRIREFQHFMKGQKRQCEELQFDHLFSSLGDYSAGLSAEVAFEARVETPKPYKVYVNRTNLLRVFENLIKNAHEALAEIGQGAKRIGMVVRLADSECDLRTDSILMRIMPEAKVQYPDAKILEIRFRDSGPGIPLEMRQDIFRYSMSDKGEGHGLGLHSAKTALNELGGDMALVDGPDGRPEFVIYLLGRPA